MSMSEEAKGPGRVPPKFCLPGHGMAFLSLYGKIHGQWNHFCLLVFSVFKLEVGVSVLEIRVNMIDLLFYLQLEIAKREILEHDDTQVCEGSIQYVNPK